MAPLTGDAVGDGEGTEGEKDWGGYWCCCCCCCICAMVDEI